MISRISESDVLSFTDHLEELRYRLIVCVLSLVVGAAAGYFLSQPALRILIKPLERANVGKKLEPVILDIRVDEQGRLRLLGGANPLLQAGPSDPDQAYRVVFHREGDAADAPPLAVIGDRPRISMIYLRPADPFILILKISIILGVILALPVILWQMWMFVAPA